MENNSAPISKPLPGQPGFKTSIQQSIEIGQDLNLVHEAALAYAQTGQESGLGTFAADYARAFAKFSETIPPLSSEFRTEAHKR